GRIDQLAAQPTLRDQSGMDELREVEGQRGPKDTKPLGDDTGRKTFRSDGHQQPKQVEPSVLRKRPEGRDRGFLVHAGKPYSVISTSLKIRFSGHRVNDISSNL